MSSFRFSNGRQHAFGTLSICLGPQCDSIRYETKFHCSLENSCKRFTAAILASILQPVLLQPFCNKEAGQPPFSKDKATLAAQPGVPDSGAGSLAGSASRLWH